MKKLSLGTPWAEGVEGERKNLQQPLTRKWWLESHPSLISCHRARPAWKL